MARLKSKELRADSGKCFPWTGGTHIPPWWGRSTCGGGWPPTLAAPLPPPPEAGTSCFFFTNSKNSATWRAYLHKQLKNIHPLDLRYQKLWKRLIYMYIYTRDTLNHFHTSWYLVVNIFISSDSWCNFLGYFYFLVDIIKSFYSNNISYFPVW